MSTRNSTIEQWEVADQVLDYLTNDGKIYLVEKKNIKARLGTLINDFYEFESTLDKLRELANL